MVSKIDEAVRLFTSVRDVPYMLGGEDCPERLFIDGFGGCTRKHMYLAPRLRALGYKVSIGMSVFDWRNLPIPSHILQLLQNPIQYHMFLFIQSNGTSVLVDATWDNKMGTLGFPVLHWDGVSSTGLAVDALEYWIQNMLVLQTRAFISSAVNKVKGLVARPQQKPFNHAFNLWLERKRKSR
jgi:hypothetical protein